MSASCRLLLALAGSAAALTTGCATTAELAPDRANRSLPAVASPTAASAQTQPDPAGRHATFATPLADRSSSGPAAAGWDFAARPAAPASWSSGDDGPSAPANAVRPTEGDVGPQGPATTNIRRVTFSQEGADFDPAISRDGRHIVFASTQHRRTSDLYMKAVTARAVTRLTDDPSDDAMPALSPDGSTIAFASNRAGNWDIYVMPAAGGRPIQITSDPADEIHPSWSPDGRSLVFNRLGEQSDRWEMWVTDVAQAGASHFIGHGLFPQWCPTPGTGADGSDRILYQLGRERGRRTFGLWTLDYSNGQASRPVELASAADEALINPSWSHDGQWIAFVRVPAPSFAHAGPGIPQGSSLWIVSADGEAPARITAGSGVAVSPAWGPGNTLFFVSDRDGRENIWSVQADGAVQTALALLNASTTPHAPHHAATQHTAEHHAAPVATSPTPTVGPEHE